MNILEKEIEDVIFEALQNSPQDLIDRGLPVSTRKVYVRQPDLSVYGRADVVGFHVGNKSRGSRHISIDIIEIKKDQITASTLLQAVRYAKAVEQYINATLKRTWADTSIILIGKSIDLNNDFLYFPDIFYGVSYYTYGIDLHKGISFKKHSGYYLTKAKFTPAIEYKEEVKAQMRDWIARKEEQPF